MGSYFSYKINLFCVCFAVALVLVCPRYASARGEGDTIVQVFRSTTEAFELSAAWDIGLVQASTSWSNAGKAEYNNSGKIYILWHDKTGDAETEFQQFKEEENYFGETPWCNDYCEREDGSEFDSDTSFQEKPAIAYSFTTTSGERHLEICSSPLM